jgi:hypothetical protein
MAIERLFSSPALYRTLVLFFEYPEEPLNPRLISRYTGTVMKSVLREIRKLEEMGILRGWSAGRYRYYLLDRDHPAHDGLRALFADTREKRKFRFHDPADWIWSDSCGG